MTGFLAINIHTCVGTKMALIVQQPVTRCIHSTDAIVNAAGIFVPQFLPQGSYSIKYHVKQPSEKRRRNKTKKKQQKIHPKTCELRREP